MSSTATVSRGFAKSVSRIFPRWLVPDRVRIILQLIHGILLDYGWLKSLRVGKPVDAQGHPVPWITQPCIDFLKQLDLRDAAVFEWGAGYSTLYWSTRVRRVVSVETNPEWISFLRPKLSSNCEIVFSEPDATEYSGKITEFRELFDIILIDGPGWQRPACAQIARTHLKQGGLVILDNSDQSLQSSAILRGHDLIEVDFTGFPPGSGYAHTTSLYFDRDYRRQPLNGYQPHKSPAQPNPPWSDA